jgi:hypothetical protein
MAEIPTPPLDWPLLCAHVRRGWLPRHRGVLPPARPGALPPDAPVAIAACWQFTQCHAFATAAAAETWRRVGPRALNACSLWTARRRDREALRVALDAIRHWRTRDARQAARARDDFRLLWSPYRRRMRMLTGQLDQVRHALAARGTPPAHLLQAAE